MSVNGASWDQDYDQAMNNARQESDPDKRILAIRALRHHIQRAENDAQRSRNIRIFEVFSSILYSYRQPGDSASENDTDRDDMLADIHHDPVVATIGDVLRCVLARPDHHLGCFEHSRGWCLDFLNLEACHFSGAQLARSSFYRTRLERADFTHARLERSDFTHADLTSSNCSHAVFSGAELSNANIAWADLSHVEMEGAFANHTNFSGAILNHGTLTRAFLSGANIAKASLIHADLHGANMFAVKIHQAKLEHTVLEGTGITKDRIDALGETVQWDAGTRWGSDDDCDGRNPLDRGYYAIK